MTWKERKPAAIAAEREKRAKRLKQTSFLEKGLEQIEPCPFDFMAHFEAGGGRHNCSCGDWETYAMFWKLSKKYGRDGTLKRMNDIFNNQYPRKGMAIAMGTMAKRPKTWTMLGILRVDRVAQPELF